MYVDIFQVVEQHLPEFIFSRKTFSCENMYGNEPVRDPTSKWYITKELYPDDTYPEFCSGSAYLLTSDGAAKIYSVSNMTKFIWIDDLFVTGILREKYNSLVLNSGGNGLDILSMKDKHVVQDTDGMLAWCKTGLESNALTYTFVHLYKNAIIDEMFCMWNKIRQMRFAMNAAVTMVI